MLPSYPVECVTGTGQLRVRLVPRLKIPKPVLKAPVVSMDKQGHKGLLQLHREHCASALMVGSRTPGPCSGLALKQIALPGRVSLPDVVPEFGLSQAISAPPNGSASDRARSATFRRCSTSGGRSPRPFAECAYIALTPRSRRESTASCPTGVVASRGKSLSRCPGRLSQTMPSLSASSLLMSLGS